MRTGHPVLEKIDRESPYFTRQITRQLNGETTQHLLEIWLPVAGEHGGWIAAVTMDGLDIPGIAGMPGEDPLDAILSALRFIRGLLDKEEGQFIFSVWNHGKLPPIVDWELAG